MRSKWSHTTFFEECTNAKFNTTQEKTFVSTDYIPQDFEMIQFKREQRKTQNNLEGKPAPDWILNGNENNTIGLKDLKSKVLMIQFTGVGCGPCHASLPFLKQLVEDYADKDFEFISIETWSKNIEGLIRYRDRNEMNFKFIRANEQIRKDYDISSVPVFFLLDKDRIIRKVINGYGKTSTDETIIKKINELI